MFPLEVDGGGGVEKRKRLGQEKQKASRRNAANAASLELG